MPTVTLSFDNGPEPSVTPYVLDVLAKHNLKASFFVMGRKVITPQGRALAMRAAAAGHWVGNHTFSHSRPLGEFDRETALSEFDKAEESLAWLHQTPRLFRPYGRQGKLGPHLLHPALIERLVAGKFSAVLWNCLAGDWRDQDGWMATAFEQLKLRDWSLLVLHDQPSKLPSPEAHKHGAMHHLDTFLTQLKDSGVTIVQEFPDDCVPIRAGRITLPLDPWTNPRTD